LFACSTRGQGYNIITDNAKESQTPLTGPPATTAHLETPLTLPESLVEVVS